MSAPGKRPHAADILSGDDAPDADVAPQQRRPLRDALLQATFWTYFGARLAVWGVLLVGVATLAVRRC